MKVTIKGKDLSAKMPDGRLLLVNVVLDEWPPKFLQLMIVDGDGSDFVADFSCMHSYEISAEQKAEFVKYKKEWRQREGAKE